VTDPARRPPTTLLPPAKIHPTALVEDGVTIGPGTSVWDTVHVRSPAKIGSESILGEKTYVAYGVSIGDRVKVNAQVYICTGVAIEDDVMVSAGVVFTNDRYPRAFAIDPGTPATSEPTEHTLATSVKTGATIGARATIGPGLEIGEFAMIGMGAVVLKDVPPHGLVYGNPARLRGYVCVCGPPLSLDLESKAPRGATVECAACGRRYVMHPEDGLRLAS
jgi:acetyltransferase-like isoleucine patch superfamily enzyme